jgi:hypothetical protein
MKAITSNDFQDELAKSQRAVASPPVAKAKEQEPSQTLNQVVVVVWVLIALLLAFVLLFAYWFWQKL